MSNLPRAHPATQLKVGLTGGIGSGKSTVAQMLVRHGAELVDADAIARQITQPNGAALVPIAQALGTHLVTPAGDLDRAALRELVFRDPTALQKLEAITHPLVAQGMDQAVAAATAPVVVLDIPLLVESRRWRHGLDRVIVVDCGTDTQWQRVKARNGWPDETIASVLQAQSPRLKRLQAADAVLCNDGIDPTQLADEVATLARLLGL